MTIINISENAFAICFLIRRYTPDYSVNAGVIFRQAQIVAKFQKRCNLLLNCEKFTHDIIIEETYSCKKSESVIRH